MDISAAISGVMGTLELAKTAIAIRDNVKIDEATKELNEKIIQFQNGVISLQGTIDSLRESKTMLADRVRELEKQIADTREFERDLANYDRHQTARGGLCYREKSSPNRGESPIYICANCVGERRKTYLQPVKDGWLLECSRHGELPSDMPEAEHEEREARKRQATHESFFGPSHR